MNEEQQEAIQRQHHAEYKAYTQSHTFQYKVDLGTRNISYAPYGKPASPVPSRRFSHMRSVESTPPFTPVPDVKEWTWQQHFHHEMHPLHPRAEARHWPTSLGRHFRFWTAQELLDTYVPRFLRQVAKANQGPVSYGCWIEHGKLDGRPHAHLHLGGVARVSRQTLKNIWSGMNGGRAVIKHFDPAKDTGYAYKYVSSRQTDASGRDNELLSSLNYFKKDRTHNSPEQAQLFRQLQGGC